ncbi:MAG: hypothetical protein ACRED2_12115, partial [Methylocella sp.]
MRPFQSFKIETICLGGDVGLADRDAALGTILTINLIAGLHSRPQLSEEHRSRGIQQPGKIYRPTHTRVWR